MVGLSMGLAGLTGMIGAFLFTRLHRLRGLNFTGVVAFSAEILCLVLALASIWAPGSLFQPYYKFSDASSKNLTANCPANSSESLVGITVTSSGSSGVETSTMGEDSVVTVGVVSDVDEDWVVSVSVILLLVGIIASRVGKCVCSKGAGYNTLSIEPSEAYDWLTCPIWRL